MVSTSVTKNVLLLSDTSRRKAVITLIAFHPLVLIKHFVLLLQFLVGIRLTSTPCVLLSLAILPKANTSIRKLRPIMILAKATACQWISASMAIFKLLVNIIFSVVKSMAVLTFNVFTLMSVSLSVTCRISRFSLSSLMRISSSTASFWTWNLCPTKCKSINRALIQWLRYFL